MNTVAEHVIAYSLSQLHYLFVFARWRHYAALLHNASTNSVESFFCVQRVSLHPQVADDGLNDMDDSFMLPLFIHSDAKCTLVTFSVM